MPEAYKFESTEHFRSMLSNIDGYIYTVIYADGKAVDSYHSPKCEEITGYAPSEYEEDPELWIRMVHPDDREFVYEFFNSRTEAIPQYMVEHRIMKKDGSVSWISNTFTEQINEKNEIARRDGFIVDVTGRKTAELALQEQNAFLQTLIDSIPNPVFYKDVHGTYKGCNNAFEDYVGKGKGDIVDKSLFELFGAEVAAIYSQMDIDLVATRQPQTYEADFTHADGSLRRVIFNKALFTDSNHRPAGIVGVMIDITEQKIIEEELKFAYAQLRELEVIVTRSPAVVFLRRAVENLPVEYVSNNVTLFGYSPNSFRYGELHYIDIVYPGDRHRFLQALERFAREHSSEFTQEYRIVQQNGKICWVDDHTWIRYSKDGEITHYHGIIIDISKRKQAVQLFRESIERYKALAENSYDLICEITKEGKILYASPNFYDTLGYGDEDLVQKKFMRFLHPDDLSQVMTEFKKGFGQVSHRFRNKNGDWLWFESAGKQYITAEGEKRGVIVSRDVTNKRKIEQQLIRSEKLLAIGEMSAMIAHEFRNALTSIKMILQLLKESVRLRNREKRSLNVALQSISHMETVIKQLLNFSQPASMNFTRANVNVVVEDCMPFIRIQAQKKAIQIAKRFDKNIPELLINVPVLKETIINLLLNATQAYEGDEIKIFRRILISTELVELPETLTDLDVGVQNEYFQMQSDLPRREIILEEGTRCALIRIMDNGCGIPEDHVDHIFEPFFTTKEKGSGLGLAVAKRTVNSHGGIIIVRSKPSKGTVFRIYIPVEQNIIVPVVQPQNTLPPTSGTPI
ncbi:MAG: PAS domain S-box protein [Ignavibacteria bacterium]|nr:PAS domain S-box protein [Ignavibacteria bacterium]